MLNDSWSFARAWDELSDNGWLWLGELIRAAVLVLVVWIAYRLVARGVRALCKRSKLPAQLAKSIIKVCGWAAVVVAVVLVLQQFNMWANAWAFLSAALALIGVGFIAMWSVLSNAACAVILMIARPFQIGDTIEVIGSDLRGQVIDFNLLFTTLRDEQGDMIQVPNNQFFQNSFRLRPGKRTVELREQLEKEAPAE
jgi:small-conductance mechanosensitive channel